MGQQQTAPTTAAPTQGAPGLVQAQQGQSQGAAAQFFAPGSVEAAQAHAVQAAQALAASRAVHFG
eukprot:7771637-Heterocapsa_arctica.AAC.1